jgi:hypothetical protein
MMARSIPQGKNLLTSQEIQAISEQYILAAMDGAGMKDDIVIQQLKESAEWMVAWKKEHQEIVEHLSEAQTVEEQKISIRKETLALIENCTITQPFLRHGLSDEQVEILLKHRHPEFSFEDARQAQYQMYIFSMASVRCLRRLSMEFSDAADEDWYDLCFEIHQQHIGHLYMQTISQLTGNEYNFESLVAVLQKMIDEVEAKVLDGKPWDFASKLQDIRQFEALQKQQSGPLDGRN